MELAIASYRKERVRFDSFRFCNFRKVMLHCFGSVLFGQIVFPVRRGSACVFRTRRGSVRFGSVRFRVRFWPVPESNAWFGSVRPLRFGFLFLPVTPGTPAATGAPRRACRDYDVGGKRGRAQHARRGFLYAGATGVSPSPKGGSEQGDPEKKSPLSDLQVMFKLFFGRIPLFGSPFGGRRVFAK